jgi:hypothetical protein
MVHTDVVNSLSALRSAAQSRDWESCKAAAEALGVLLPSRHLIAIAAAELRRRVPGFLRVEPGQEWPERILTTIESGEVPKATMLPTQDYKGPGANSFYVAMEMLMESVYSRDDQAASARSAVSAIAEAIMAGMAESWGTRNRERWNRWYEAASSEEGTQDEDVITTLFGMKSDLEVGAIYRQSWLDVADALERALLA